MSIKPNDRIPISKAHLILETGRTYSTIDRWVRVGLLNRITGKMVKLKTRRHGGGVYTTREWYEVFQEKLNEEGEE